MNREELAATAKAIVALGKGLLAVDESNRTCNARAIQQPVLQLWQGLRANAKGAQDALLYRAKCNRAAREGKYSKEMEMAEPGRLLKGVSIRT